MHQPYSRLLYKGKGIFFQPGIISHVGGRAASQFLQQIHYFITSSKIKGTTHLGCKWIYQTLDQWAGILGYSPSTIKNCIRILQNLNIIKVDKLCKYKSNRTNFYTINYDVLSEILENKANTVGNNEKELSANDLKNDNMEQAKIVSQKAKNCPMVITKKTNKEINNKSEKKINTFWSSSEIVVSNDFSDKMKQVQQVKIKKIELKKEKTGTDTVSHSHSSPKTTVAQDMLAIWNKTFEKNQASMSKQLAPLLVAAYKHKFDSDIQKWKHYCLSLASSPYLTGETFNLSLLWALKYTTIDRVNNYEFGVKEMITSTYSKRDALIHIDRVNEPEMCKEVRGKLLTAYGEKVYKDWFEELHFEIIGHEICFKAKNNFINDYVKNKFGDLFIKRVD